MPFVELALIRWVGSNVVYFSHFSNLIFPGSFLEIGMGFFPMRPGDFVNKMRASGQAFAVE